MNVFRIPKHDQDPSEEMVDWLSHFDGWDGDENGITIPVEGSDEMILCNPGDWLTESGGKLVRLPADGRVLKKVQTEEDGEMTMWVWPLPDGRAIYLFNGVEPMEAYLAPEDNDKGNFFPERNKK